MRVKEPPMVVGLMRRQPSGVMRLRDVLACDRAKACYPCAAAAGLVFYFLLLIRTVAASAAL